MQSDFVKLNELMKEQELLYKSLLKKISDICKNRSMPDYQKVKEIEKITDMFKGD